MVAHSFIVSIVPIDIISRAVIVIITFIALTGLLLVMGGGVVFSIKTTKEIV